MSVRAAATSDRQWVVRLVRGLLSTIALLPIAGCVVPQPQGQGKLRHVVEPVTGRGYWLYLPSEYVQLNEQERAERRWPLVVTFHGMKPYDIAFYQAREWEQEADRYGYIVVSPELRTFDFFFGEFPLRNYNAAFKSDDVATMAILDHVLETTEADPTRVLSTSWSSGGYMAHYMLNRHPERFSCLAVRQSNFTASVLDHAGTSRSVYHPVLIVSTENDIPICKDETREAIKWYDTHGYRNFAWVCINRLGHERTPDMAADFFARTCGIQPNRPAEVLVHRHAIDGNATGLALLAGKFNRLEQPPGGGIVAGRTTGISPAPTPRRPTIVSASPAPEPTAISAPPPERPEPPPPPTPKRDVRAVRASGSRAPVAIRVSSAIGFAPLLLVYSAECPSDWQRSADFYWTLSGKSIGHGVNGQRTIAEPGEYTLELLVVTPQGAEHRATHTIRVLQDTDARASASAGHAGTN